MIASSIVNIYLSVALPNADADEFEHNFPLLEGDRFYSKAQVGSRLTVIHFFIHNWYMRPEQIDYLMHYANIMNKEKKADQWRHWLVFDKVV